MGIYINPPDNDKEPWLRLNGVEAASAEVALKTANWKTLFPVCLVHNPSFSAAAVCDSEREFEAFNDLKDLRPKLWFIVGIDKLTDDVIGETYAKHLRKLTHERTSTNT